MLKPETQHVVAAGPGDPFAFGTRMGSSLDHGGFGKQLPHCQSASIRRAGEFAFGHVAFEMRDEIALGKSGNRSACHVRADRFPHPRWTWGTAFGG